MTPPRLRLRLVDPLESVPEDSPVRPPERHLAAADAAPPVPTDGPLEPLAPVPANSLLAPPAPVPADSLFAPTEPVPADSLPAPTSDPADSLLAPVSADSLPAHTESVPADSLLAPVPADSQAALAEVDAVLAAPTPLADDACARLVALAVQVPGRQRAVTAALARTASTAAIAGLRALPPATPGLLAALIECFARGAPRLPPVPGDSPAPLLALEFRGSRARGFPDLVARAQAIAATRPAAEFAAFDLDGRRHYRLTFWPDRSPTAALALQLRSALSDLAWLHGRLVRLRGSRLWLAGWRFDADDPLGPAAQARLLHVWVQGWLDRAREPRA